MDGIEYGKSVHANSNEIAGIAAMITSLANAFGRTGQAGLSEELYEHADNLIIEIIIPALHLPMTKFNKSPQEMPPTGGIFLPTSHMGRICIKQVD